jgi:hypothetical protein
MTTGARPVHAPLLGTHELLKDVQKHWTSVRGAIGRNGMPQLAPEPIVYNSIAFLNQLFL